MRLAKPYHGCNRFGHFFLAALLTTVTDAVTHTPIETGGHPMQDTLSDLALGALLMLSVAFIAGAWLTIISMVEVPLS